VNKTAASAAQSAKCILLHGSARTTVAPGCARTNKNFIFLIFFIFYFFIFEFLNLLKYS